MKYYISISICQFSLNILQYIQVKALTKQENTFKFYLKKLINRF